MAFGELTNLPSYAQNLGTTRLVPYKCYEVNSS